MKPNFCSLTVSPGHTLLRYASYVGTRCYNKQMGSTSMCTAHQMCPTDHISFSSIFLAVVPNSNNSFRNELGDSYPGDPKLSDLSGQVSVYGRACEKFRTNCCVGKAGAVPALTVQLRGGCLKACRSVGGEQSGIRTVEVGSVRISKRKQNFSFTFEKRSTWYRARQTGKESVPSFVISS